MERKLKKGNMYENTKLWDPFVGCRFDCTYCVPSYKRQLKRVGGRIRCPDCREYKPHTHPERLRILPSSSIIFVCGAADIRFCQPDYTRQIIDSIKRHKPRKEKTYYFQSKNPAYFNQFLDEFPDTVILLTTLETNRDEGYPTISKAPLPSRRFKEFYDLDYPRKVATIEPVMDFDLEQFSDWIIQLHEQGNLEYVWFGFNSKPKAVQLPEPSQEKAQEFIDILEGHEIIVKGKTIRDLKLMER